MKSLLSIVIAITMVISTSGLSFAAFVSLDSETFSASSGAVGAPADPVTVPFGASLKNISNNANAASITWPAVTAGVTAGWLAANQYIEVKGWTVYSNWGIQIYTNNTNYIGTGNPAGLVNTSNTIYSLPMAWRANTEKVPAAHTDLQIIQKIDNGYTVLADGTTPAIQYYPWFFMLDKGTPDVDIVTPGNQLFGNAQAEATFIGSAGYHHAPGPVNYATPWATDTKYYIYLGANFIMAMSGATYTTSSLTVEMYRL